MPTLAGRNNNNSKLLVMTFCNAVSKQRKVTFLEHEREVKGVCSRTLTDTVLYGVDVRWILGCGTDSSVWQVLVQATLSIAA